MSFRKAVTSIAVLLVTGLLLAACGSEGGDSESSSGDKTVKFMHIWPEGSSAQHNKVVNEIIEDFEAENEDVSIDLEVLSNAQYKDKIKVLSTSDELHDVSMTCAAGYMEPYVAGNMYAPLDDRSEEDNFVYGTTKVYTFD